MYHHLHAVRGLTKPSLIHSWVMINSGSFLWESAKHIFISINLKSWNKNGQCLSSMPRFSNVSGCGGGTKTKWNKCMVNVRKATLEVLRMKVQVSGDKGGKKRKETIWREKRKLQFPVNRSVWAVTHTDAARGHCGYKSVGWCVERSQPKTKEPLQQSIEPKIHVSLHLNTFCSWGTKLRLLLWKNKHPAPLIAFRWHTLLIILGQMV